MQLSDDVNGKERRQDVSVGILTESGAGGDDDGGGGAAVNGIDYEKVLDKIGFGKTQWILLLISGLMTLNSLAAQTSVGILAIASQCEFNMSQSQKGVMMAACVAGIFLSTYIWGYVCDAVGRRTVLLYSQLATNLLQLISMFVTNIWIFNLINLIMGVSLGGGAAAMYPYLSEFNTAKHRAVVINYSTMFVAVAAIYVPATAWWVLSANWSFELYDGFAFRPWRLIILVNLVPGLIGALMLLPFPESPKLLLAQNRESQAMDAVAWICKFNTGRPIERVLNKLEFKLKPEVIEVDDILANRRGCSLLIDIWKAMVPLFHKPHNINFIISIIVVFGMFFSSNGMQFWFPEIVNRSSGEAAANSSTVCEILDASFAQQASNMTLHESQICDDSIKAETYIDNIIVGVAFFIGFSIQGMLLNPLGRKNVLMAAITIAAICGILLHFVVNTTAVLILFCLYILMPGLSISIMLGSVVDLVPTHLRGKAVSICLTFGRLGIIVATNLMGVMLEPMCNTTFGMFTTSLIVCVVLVRFLPI